MWISTILTFKSKSTLKTNQCTIQNKIINMATSLVAVIISTRERESNIQHFFITHVKKLEIAINNKTIKTKENQCLWEKKKSWQNHFFFCYNVCGVYRKAYIYYKFLIFLFFLIQSKGMSHHITSHRALSTHLSICSFVVDDSSFFLNVLFNFLIFWDISL